MTSVGNRTLEYDANGNMIRDRVSGTIDREITYSAFDKAVTISRGSSKVEPRYGADRCRYLRIDQENGIEQARTVYVGSVETTYNADGSQDIRRLLGNVIIKRHRDVANGPQTTETSYVLRDHLGSVNVLLDKQGNLRQAGMAFSAWGERADPVDWRPLTAIEIVNVSLAVTNRGYTGHEMLDTFGIVHMNGSVFG